MSDKIQIGLALSGGTAKSVTHIGVLKALEEAGIEITRIAGTSGGAIIASMYAAGIPIEGLAAQARRTKLTDLGGLGFARLGFLSSDKLYQMVADQIGDVEFDQLRLPLSVVVTNLQTGAREVLESGVVARAAQASACIPQIYAPVEMNGALYVDGGLVEYLPTRTLVQHELPLVVGVNLGYHRQSHRPRHFLALIMQTMGIIAQHNAAISEIFANVVIRPDLTGFSPFEIKEAERMIRVGYEETVQQIPAIRAAWRDLHSWRGRLGRWWDRRRGGPHDHPPWPVSQAAVD